MSVAALAASAVIVATFIYSDGVMDCNDGARYTSGKPQPTPFHRRWCGWPKRVLQVVSILSLVVLGGMMGSWQRAVLLMALPGAWFAATHPTTVDAPAMLLAWLSATLMPINPYAAVLLACVSGYVHERGPVFAALYAWHPLPLLGLVAVGWWRTPAPRDADKLVGGGVVEALRAHRPYFDPLDMRFALHATGALPAVFLWYGANARGVVAYAVAFASRAIGTDGARFMWWAAPAMVAAVPANVHPVAVLGSVLLLRRMI